MPALKGLTANFSHATLQFSAELAQKVAKLLPKIGNIVADDVPVSDDEDKDNKIVNTFGPTPAGAQYMHHHEVKAFLTQRVLDLAYYGYRRIADLTYRRFGVSWIWT